MANAKRETYTDLLVREICSHLEWAAAESSGTPAESNALYRAARLIGRNKNDFVQRALAQMDWYGKMQRVVSQEPHHVR